ncbi:2-oxo acid dehydrogenase subunit E2 [Nocardioides sp.]|uniref:2-oxo acid dehydrogenase subunit E2 n=1 Tax=Nocardioides sp. TaxID=35761 RepID=UPI0037834EFB
MTSGQVHGDLDVDAANLTTYAAAVGARAATPVTVTHLVGRAVARGLLAVPELRTAGTDVFFADRGVTVERVDDKPVTEVARELAAAARAPGTQPVGPAVVLTSAEDGFTRAYEPLPEAGGVTVLVVVGAVSQRPVAIEGRVVIRPVLTLTATFDRDRVDGRRAAAFAAAVREYCAHPEAFEPPGDAGEQPAGGSRSDARSSG